MIEQTETSVVVRHVVDAHASDLFAVLADPRRHVDIDGSGMLRASAGTTQITATGQIFTMEMHYPSLGDYRTDNCVIEFDLGRSIAWTTSREGQPPAGVRWSWSLEPQADGRTEVVHGYDWSGVTDPAIKARVSFPRVAPQDLEESVTRLAKAAA